MDGGLQSELRALQARAYGPGDGLAGDDTARRRLEELESRALAERARPPVIDAVPAPVDIRETEPPPLPSVPPGEAARTFATPRVEPETLQRARTRRRLTGLTWAGSLAMVATLAVGVTAAATSRVAWTGSSAPPGTDITHVATLTIDPDREWPESYGSRPQDGAVFEEFAEITPLVGSMPTGGGITRCLQLLPPEAWGPQSDEGWSWYGYGGCNVEPYAATTSLVIGPDAPSGLRERFPEGTRLQFVTGDGVVEVFSADAPTAEATR